MQTMLPLILLSSLAPAASLRNTHRTRDGAAMESQACSRMQAALEQRKDSRGKALVASDLEKACMQKSHGEAAEFFCTDHLRFSCQGKTDLPVVHYPATMNLSNSATTSDAVSVRLFLRGQVAGTSWPYTINSIAPLARPTQPESGTPFWTEFDQITQLQISRRSGEMAANKMVGLPAIFMGKTMEEGAALVEKDFPAQFPTELVEQFLAEGVDFDETIIPHATADDFVNKQVMLSRIIGWAIGTVSPICFAAKWHEGRPRPEEVAWAVASGDPRVAGAPAAVVSRVQSLSLTSPGFDYTAYTRGSPKHPSWPAMHSAASTASVYLPIVLNLTAAQLRETQLLDCAVASFRSFAGVHYESDNMAGLAIGQEVVRKELPGMLYREYGSSPAAVRAKLEKLISGGLYPGHTGHDWRTAPSCLK